MFFWVILIAQISLSFNTHNLGAIIYCNCVLTSDIFIRGQLVSFLSIFLFSSFYSVLETTRSTKTQLPFGTSRYVLWYIVTKMKMKKQALAKFRSFQTLLYSATRINIQPLSRD